MAANQVPDFRSGVTERDIYGERNAQGMANEMSMGGARGGGGGFPWFRGSNPSPFNPTGPTQAPQATDQPPPDQGPPDMRKPGGIGGMFGGMDSKDIMALLAALTGGVGAFTGGGSGQPSSATSDPAMQEVLNLMAGRLRKSEPMFDSALSMTNGLLPTQYQNRGGG